MDAQDRIVEPTEEDVSDVSELDQTEETKEQAEQTPKIPEKFAGKSAEEIAESYRQLESELGRKSNELGELRRLTDQYLHRELESKQSDPGKEAPKQVTSDDFFDDPANAVSKLLETNPKLREVDELKQQLTRQQQEAARQRFVEKHPDYQDVGQDADFVKWVSDSPVRRRLYSAADTGNDFDAADELLSLWKERVELSAPRKKESPDKARLESSASKGSSKKVYRRSDLIRLRMDDPAKYEAMGDEIRAAYAQGRVK